MPVADATTEVSTPAYLKALVPIVDKIVDPLAVEIDRDGRYPAEAIEALGEAGLLGLVTAEGLGGMGESHRAATLVVEELARHCGSTAMVVLMHYSGAAVVEAFGPKPLRRQIGEGKFVTTLAFSETGSRSMFWVPEGTATPSEDGETVRLDGQKSWVTSASQADGYVWSSLPAHGDGRSTLWMVPTERSGTQPAGTAGLTVGEPFDGMGLRGNDSRPVTADGVEVPADAMLGPDGGGFDIMLGLVLPYFQLMSAGFSVATADDSTLKAAAHAGSARFEHLDQSLAENLLIRSNVARMRIKTDQAWTLLLDAIAALETERQDAILRVLEVKAAAAEMALEVTELAMRVCGGTGFKRELGVERHFRDARAAGVMAPTTDTLYDFLGRLLCGLPLF
jgi:alkylation response protein AidB-like acyl-CoA dehydrogenase